MPFLRPVNSLGKQLTKVMIENQGSNQSSVKAFSRMQNLEWNGLLEIVCHFKGVVLSLV